MTIEQEQLSDEDLASKISEDGRLSQDSPTHEEEGFLETGVHANSAVLEDTHNSSKINYVITNSPESSVIDIAFNKGIAWSIFQYN